jgi:hypothetical protein
MRVRKDIRNETILAVARHPYTYIVAEQIKHALAGSSPQELYDPNSGNAISLFMTADGSANQGQARPERSGWSHHHDPGREIQRNLPKIQNLSPKVNEPHLYSLFRQPHMLDIRIRQGALFQPMVIDEQTPWFAMRNGTAEVVGIVINHTAELSHSVRQEVPATSTAGFRSRTRILGPSRPNQASQRPSRNRRLKP